MVPTQALAVPTWLLFAEVDLTNSPLSIILPCSVSPFGVFLMRIYAARAIDSSLIEAARLDGAGEWRIFRSIVFRLLAPGMVTVMLFAFVADVEQLPAAAADALRVQVVSADGRAHPDRLRGDRRLADRDRADDRWRSCCCSGSGRPAWRPEATSRQQILPCLASSP